MHQEKPKVTVSSIRFSVIAMLVWTWKPPFKVMVWTTDKATIDLTAVRAVWRLNNTKNGQLYQMNRAIPRPWFTNFRRVRERVYTDRREKISCSVKLDGQTESCRNTQRQALTDNFR